MRARGVKAVMVVVLMGASESSSGRSFRRGHWRSNHGHHLWCYCRWRRRNGHGRHPRRCHGFGIGLSPTVRAASTAYVWLLMAALVIYDASFSTSAYGQGLSSDNTLNWLTAQDLTEPFIPDRRGSCACTVAVKARTKRSCNRGVLHQEIIDRFQVWQESTGTATV